MLTRCARRQRRGGALLEFMLLLPFYCTLFFGALDFGLLFYERVQLTNACREGLRRAAAGDPVREVKRGAREAAPRLKLRDNQISVEYNTTYDGTGTWVDASDTQQHTANAIATGMLCRVRVTDCDHRMLSGAFLRWLPNVRNGHFEMDASEVMVRQ